MNCCWYNNIIIHVYNIIIPHWLPHPLLIYIRSKFLFPLQQPEDLETWGAFILVAHLLANCVQCT